MVELAEVWKGESAVWSEGVEVYHVADFAGEGEEGVAAAVLAWYADVLGCVLGCDIESEHRGDIESPLEEVLDFISGAGKLKCFLQS